jgi:hypothetical protein
MMKVDTRRKSNRLADAVNRIEVGKDSTLATISKDMTVRLDNKLDRVS